MAGCVPGCPCGVGCLAVPAVCLAVLRGLFLAAAERLSRPPRYRRRAGSPAGSVPVPTAAGQRVKALLALRPRLPGRQLLQSPGPCRGRAAAGRGSGRSPHPARPEPRAAPSIHGPAPPAPGAAPAGAVPRPGSSKFVLTLALLCFYFFSLAGNPDGNRGECEGAGGARGLVPRDRGLLCRALAPSRRTVCPVSPERWGRRQRELAAGQRYLCVPACERRAGNTAGPVPAGTAAGWNISGDSGVWRKCVPSSSAVGTEGAGSGPGAASCSQSPVVGPGRAHCRENRAPHYGHRDL